MSCDSSAYSYEGGDRCNRRIHFQCIAFTPSDRWLELAQASPWMTRAQAAEYLGVPRSRLEKDRQVPSHRWEGRVLYHRDELDEYVLGFGGRP